MDADAGEELREIAGLAALACGAHVVALVPRADADSHVGGPGAYAAGLPRGAVHALQLAHATVDLHVIARVPVSSPADVRLGTLVAYARALGTPLGRQQAMLGGFARLAGRALARADASAGHPVGRATALTPADAQSALDRARDQTRVRALAPVLLVTVACRRGRSP